MRTILLLSLGLMITACASGRVTRTGKEYPARPADWPITVYAQGGTVPDEVARICSSGSPRGKQIGRVRVSGAKATAWGKLMNQARSEARNIGGDEVMFTKGDTYLRSLEGRVYRRE